MFFKKKKSKFEKIKKWLQVHVLNLFKKKKSKFLLRPKARNLIFGSFLILVLLVSSFYLFFRPEQATAEWWDINWHYRKAITITNNGSAQTDFQVLVTADTSDTTKFQDDCDDLRFTSVNGQALDYWIESGCGTATTKIWVKISSIPAGTSTMYMYYGNPNASSYQNGDNTFEFFDDFDAADTSKWEYTGSGYSYAEGVLSIYGSDYEPLESIQSFSNDGLIVRSKIKRDATGDFDSGIWFAFAGGNSGILHVFDDIANGDHCGIVYPSWATVVANYTTEMSVGSWETIEMWRSGTTVYSSAFGEELSATIDVNYSNPIALFSDSDAGTRTASYEYILIRKYATTEPTTILQSEERGPGPVGYWSFDEGYGTTAQDRTSNNNDGTFLSAPVWKTEEFCVSGKCLAFDNIDDGVSITNENFTFLTDYTMSAWVNIKGNHKHYTGTIMSSGDWNNVHWAFGLSQGNTAINLRKVDGVHSPSKSYSFSKNKWYHVAVTRKGATITYYVNGISLGTYTGATGNLISNASNTTIGRETYAGGYFDFNGWIDEPKIYDYARSAEQIKADYNARGGATSKGTAVSMGRPSSGSEALSDGLVGYWKMDESSGNVIDASGNGNTGTWYGTGSHYAAGKFGDGGGFNGTDDYVDCGNDAGNFVMGNGGHTLEAWVYPMAVSNNYNYIVAIGDNTTGHQSGFGIRSTSQLYLSAYSSPIVNTNYTIPALNQWYHFAMSYNSATDVASFYVNGAWVEDKSITINITNGKCRIGAHTGNAGFFNNGKIDEVRIYNRALSDREVRQLYEWAPGPVGYWKMDEKVGTTAYDSSGNDNNGTLINMEESDWVPGKYGSGLDFDNDNDYVSLGVNSDISNLFASDATITMWVKPEDITTSKSLISSYESNYSDGYVFRMIRDDLDFRITYSGGYNNYQWSNIFEAGNYYHLALVNDSSTNKVRLYVNGIDQGESDAGSGTYVDSSANNVAIGSWWGTSGYWPFNGQIDEVKVYNYARTQKQILEDMNAGRPAQKSPVLYYSFDNDIGSTVHDQSIYSRNGSTGGYFTQSGKFNKAISLTGGQNVNVSDVSNSNIDFGTKSFTVMSWVYYTGGTYPRTVFPVRKGVCYRGAGDIGFEFDHGYYSNGISSVCINDGTNMSRGNINYDSGSRPTDFINNWVHLVVVYDRDQGKAFVYVNGKKQANYLDISLTTGSIDNNASLNIGNVSGWYLDGNLDEFKIYNYALTQDEIKAEYNQGKVSVMGAVGGDGGGSTSTAGTAEYCVPGSSDSCDPPVAEWNFEEHSGSTAYDTSGNGNTGTITNASWTTGKIGSALSFNADASIYMGTGINVSDAVTLEAWVYPTGYGDGDYRTIVQKRNGSGSVYEIYLHISNGAFSYFNGTQYISTFIPPLNQWTHLVATNNNGSLKLYANGKEVYQNTGIVIPSNATAPVYVGQIYGGSEKFKGKIDQVRIYDYARTPAQIAWDYNKGKPIAHWRFDEGQGATLYDSSGNGNHGTLNLGSSDQTEPGSVKTSANTPWYNGRNGKLNYSLNFDGEDDYVVAPYDSSLSNNSHTVLTWVKFNEIVGSGGTNRKTIYIDEASWAIGLWADSGTIRAHCDGKYATLVWEQNTEWRQVGQVYDKDSNILYLVIDGQIYSADQTTYSATPSGNFIIGDVIYTTSTAGFPGLIDEVKIFNYALTEDQIKTEYNMGAARFGTGN